MCQAVADGVFEIRNTRHLVDDVDWIKILAGDFRHRHWLTRCVCMCGREGDRVTPPMMAKGYIRLWAQTQHRRVIWATVRNTSKNREINKIMYTRTLAVVRCSIRLLLFWWSHLMCTSTCMCVWLCNCFATTHIIYYLEFSPFGLRVPLVCVCVMVMNLGSFISFSNGKYYSESLDLCQLFIIVLWLYASLQFKLLIYDFVVCVTISVIRQ